MRTTDVRVLRAIHSVAAGRPVVVIADTERDGAGYVVFAADAATPEVVAFTVRHTSGLVRVALPLTECERLNLPPMCATDRNHSYATGQRVSVDAIGSGTGISASDRARTIAALASEDARPGDFHRPGHVIPVRADADGVLGRPSAVDAAVDLTRLAGRREAAALCEIVSRENPTEIACGAEAVEFARRHGLPAVTVHELAAYRRRTEPQVVRLAEAALPIGGGKHRVIGFRDVHAGAEHLVLIVGAVGSGEPVPLHVHVECVTGDVFGSTGCDCGAALSRAISTMSAEGSGVIVYLRPRGAMHACGLSPIDRAAGPGLVSDTVSWILRDLGVYSVRTADDAPGFGLVIFGTIRESRGAA